MNNIDWENIRPIRGSQQTGFEELCAQLARAGSPEGATFIRKGSPDAGVECFCVFPDESEWGWQAKYFTTRLTPSQWQQLDDSVKAALDHHPNLTSYFICIPHDRADARTPGTITELDRWHGHVKKWEEWAVDKHMNVEFVWWGASELIDKLSLSEHVGRRYFWFGHPEFDQVWFEARLNEAVKAAGPRYTPEIHVDLPIAQDLERFGRSDLLIDEVKSLAVGIRRTSNRLRAALQATAQTVQVDGTDNLFVATDAVLAALATLNRSPVGILPFLEIASMANEAHIASSLILDQLWAHERERRQAGRGNIVAQNHDFASPLDLLSHVQSLLSRFQGLVDTCNQAHSLANGQLLLLKGDGSTGKTHLLCDAATRRIDAHLPTVLLMGQRFLGDEDPWTQLLQQLDLTGCSAEEFVGALEAASQAADSRALVFVDALNEGNGRTLWPTHLSAFLTRLERSPWIRTVLAIRSSYEVELVPQEVRERAIALVHHGFSDHEYDATRAYFDHFGLEFPSTPILHPEFRNPLLLKTVCSGLHDSGERRMPKGFKGITGVFDLYFRGINIRLAQQTALDYDPMKNLVRLALERIAEHLAEGETRWLVREEAQSVVNALLPERGFSKSLYSALVTEGILTEDLHRTGLGPSEDIVFISYDRLADHLVADHLLRSLLDINHPEAAFSTGGGLVFICEKERFVPPGLIEALCIQMPEWTGQELPRLAPSVVNRPTFAYAYFQSIVWRKPDAFFEDTRVVLNKLVLSEGLWEDALDALLSLSTVPEHPWNADFLDQRLRKDPMPVRDSWWSVYLHRTRGLRGPVDRLVDWASAIAEESDLDDDVVDLAATALAWMFTTPNRVLRDKATKALVQLLSGRLEATRRLVDRFADVDDWYVTERVYAAAYGVAMRSQDAEAVGALAHVVFERVFASGSPPPHVLLRDYARGVIERALHLSPDLAIESTLIRPPYESIWPSIPSEDEVEDLTPNWGNGAWDDGDLEWSRNRIRHSVLDEIGLGDFARYVIGSTSESQWLALDLNEAPWQSTGDRTNVLHNQLSVSERLAYDECKRAEGEPSPLLGQIRRPDSNDADNLSIEIQQHQERVDAAREQLLLQLEPDHRIELESIWLAESDGPPRFDVGAIQRYVLWRVFDLGWTIERFGEFDRFSIGDHGRSANKPERFGKKYQWIAYHEILALIADHYQFREWSFNDAGERMYEGPWQLHVRDIDPSCTLACAAGGTSWGPHTHSWWGAERYEAWGEGRSHQSWLADCNELPVIERLLELEHPRNGTRWLNVDGAYAWQQPYSPDQEPYEQARRELRIEQTAYFVRDEEAESFVSWAKNKRLRWHSMPMTEGASEMYLGEYGWSAAFRRSLPNLPAEDWGKPESTEGIQCPVAIRPISFEYLSEAGGFDCSVEGHISLNLPHHEFMHQLGLTWSHSDVGFLDASGDLAAFDPTGQESGPSALLLNKRHLDKYLKETGLTLCWVVIGEKLVVGGNAGSSYLGRLIISGAYRLSDQGLVGGLNCSLEIPEGNPKG